MIYALATDRKTFNTQDILEYIVDHPDNHPESGRPISTRYGDYAFFKTHHKMVCDYQGNQIDTRFFIYVYRNPLDVFVSYLNYIYINRADLQIYYDLPLVSVQEHIERGTIRHFFSMFLTVGNISPGADQAGSWWDSIRRWHDLKARYGAFIFMLKYEDAMEDPLNTFSPLAEFLNSNVSVEEALERTNYNFPKDGNFFWKMSNNYYKEYLPDELIEEYKYYYGAELKDIGYEI